MQFLSYVQFEYDQQEEPRIYPPECIRVEKQVGQVSSANLTEEILDYLRINQKSFEKQCAEIEKQIKELVENIETEDEVEPIQSRKPQKRN
ncbi:unnamed protein product [Paramecium primaurelia]|uniref:Uncharacterized protein n=1 Tax=Paramecium primaurelia TaxID=5886 RepID=A0A8S1LJ89_PARPR|nr:unnamed protein product [Paramecium primaurelia]